MQLTFHERRVSNQTPRLKYSQLLTNHVDMRSPNPGLAFFVSS